MGITLGNILEPIAPLCSPKDPKPWNGMIKLHLRNPSTDGRDLLAGTRIFALLIDGSLKVPKICKGYDSPAPRKLLTVKVKDDILLGLPAHQLMLEIVSESFNRGCDFEIAQANKSVDDRSAYLIAATPEQGSKLIKHQIIVFKKILTPTAAADDALSRTEIEKKNCLTLIVRDCNIYYPASVVTKALQTLIGDRNVVKTFFKDGDAGRDLHAGVCNIEVLNAVVYKKLVNTNAKLLQKVITFHPHPRSLDGSNAPSDKILKQFGFLDHNTALAGAMTAMANQPHKTQEGAMTRTEIHNLVESLEQKVNEKMAEVESAATSKAIAASQKYTDTMTAGLRGDLNDKLAAIMESLISAKQLINNSSPRLTNFQEN